MLAPKECSTCKQLKALNGENFAPRRDRPAGWYPECRECLNAKSRERYARAELKEPAEMTMPKAKAEDAAEREAGIRRAAEREIARLIRRYEAVRFAPGPDRASSYNALAVALQRHGRCVGDGVREWEWSPALGEITSRLLKREWKPPADRHADPRHVARDELRTAGIDLVELT